MNALDYVIKKLAKGESLPAKYCDHKLQGGLRGYRECHIEPDWLLIYYLTKQEMRLERTGSHSELYK
jgi:mRNA interferase YafQ